MRRITGLGKSCMYIAHTLLIHFTLTHSSSHSLHFTPFHCDTWFTSLHFTSLHCTLLYFTFLYFTLLYFTLLYFTLLYFTLLYFTLLYFTLLYFTLLYFTLLYFTLLYFTLLYFTLLYFTLLYFTLLYFTLLYYICEKPKIPLTNWKIILIEMSANWDKINRSKSCIIALTNRKVIQPVTWLDRPSFSCYLNYGVEYDTWADNLTIMPPSPPTHTHTISRYRLSNFLSSTEVYLSRL